ncbi:MAG: GNAT family N-acetyltransferase [Gammaproteobacteria bacterium]|nr:GNAT family N-acetyltransferase [Gammaproteobacteria bacterium]
MTLRTEVVRDWDAFIALRGEWNALLARSGADAVFLTWEWLSTWLDCGARQWQPLLVLVRNGAGTLLGVGPFYFADYRLLGSLPVRVLRLAGDHPTGAEYGDIIAEREHEAPVCTAIGSALRAERGRWDALWMPNVAGWDGAPQRLRLLASAAGLQLRTRPIRFGYIDLPATLADYENLLSANRRQQIRRKRRNLLKVPAVALSSPNDAVRLDGALQDLFRLHHARWMTRGDPGTFERKPMQAEFYRRFAPVALANGWLRLHVLSHDGSARAVQYGYCYKGTFLQLQEGFDPAYQADAGNVLRHYAIESSIAEGIRVYDFLGEMTEHKSRWQAKSRSGCDMLLINATVRALPLRRLPLWPTGRYLRGRGPFAPSSGLADEPANVTAD